MQVTLTIDADLLMEIDIALSNRIRELVKADVNSEVARIIERQMARTTGAQDVVQEALIKQVFTA